MRRLLVVGLLASCTPATPLAEPEVPAVRVPDVAPTNDVAAAPVEPAKDDSAIIDAYRAIDRAEGKPAEYDAFIAAHPELLTASASPYGDALAWVLEFEEEEGALALLRAGAPPQPGALTVAARGGLDRLVEPILARGVKPDDDGGFTPLQAAAKYGHLSTVKLLLKHGATIGAAGDDGFTALHHAVIERREDVVAALIVAKAPLEARDRNGRTPLSWGPFAYTPQPIHIYRKIGEPHDTRFSDPGPARAIELLLKAGAKIDTTDDDGNTPLHEAVTVRSLRGVEALLAAGADVDAENDAGETPRSLAPGRDPEIAKLLARKRR